MNYDLLIQNTDVIEEYFLVFKDSREELFWGDDLQEIKNAFAIYYATDDVSFSSEEERTVFLSQIENVEEKDLIKIEIKLGKPDFATNSTILSGSNSNGTDGLPKIDFVEYNRLRLVHLLKDWNIERNGRKVPINSITLGNLHPNFIDAILTKLNKHVPHYFKLMLS